MPWLHAKQNYFEIILKLFQRFISHVTTAADDYMRNKTLK